MATRHGVIENTPWGHQYNAVLNQIDFIAGSNNTWGRIVKRVGCNVWFETNGEMINEENNTNQSHVDILGNFEGYNKNYRSLNETDTDREGFMDLDLPWFLK